MARKINKIRQEILVKIDTAMKTNDTNVFNVQIDKWIALDGYIQTIEPNKINWFSFNDWDERHFGLYKARYLPKTKSFFNETLFTLALDLEDSYELTNKRDWLKVIDRRVQLLQLKHFLGHKFGSIF